MDFTPNFSFWGSFCKRGYFLSVTDQGYLGWFNQSKLNDKMLQLELNSSLSLSIYILTVYPWSYVFCMSHNILSILTFFSSFIFLEFYPFYQILRIFWHFLILHSYFNYFYHYFYYNSFTILIRSRRILVTFTYICMYLLNPNLGGLFKGSFWDEGG